MEEKDRLALLKKTVMARNKTFKLGGYEKYGLREGDKSERDLLNEFIVECCDTQKMSDCVERA